MNVSFSQNPITWDENLKRSIIQEMFSSPLKEGPSSSLDHLIKRAQEQYKTYFAAVSQDHGILVEMGYRTSTQFLDGALNHLSLLVQTAWVQQNPK